jgi:hypothetical protein
MHVQYRLDRGATQGPGRCLQSSFQGRIIDNWVRSVTCHRGWSTIDNWVRSVTCHRGWSTIDNWVRSVERDWDWQIIDNWVRSVTVPLDLPTIDNWVRSVTCLRVGIIIDNWVRSVAVPLDLPTIDNWVRSVIGRTFSRFIWIGLRRTKPGSRPLPSTFARNRASPTQFLGKPAGIPNIASPIAQPADSGFVRGSISDHVTG